MIELNERHEYDYVKKHSSHEPLIHSSFKLSHELRIELQKEMWPKYSVENNQRFYKWFWNNYPDMHLCEETGIWLTEFSPVHISHILPRGSFPHMAYDARNINLLSFDAHQQWGDPHRRKTMRIYERNLETMQILRDEYR